MGDLITQPVDGELYFIAATEFERVRQLQLPDADLVSIYADMARINALYMIANAGSGHIGSSFSSLDIVSTLYLRYLRKDQDIYFSSKGHDVPGLYAVLIAEGVLAEDNLHKLRVLEGLPGHPDIQIPGIFANTGSLGMGISKAKGMLIGAAHRGLERRVVVLLGDGELQEGQFWESLISAANMKLGSLTAIVDHNKIQSDYSVSRTSDLGDLEAKVSAFGWEVRRIDGHDPEQLMRTLHTLDAIPDRPKLIIADTIKGNGVSFMRGDAVDCSAERYAYHSGAPTSKDYRNAAAELLAGVNEGLTATGAEGLSVERRQGRTLETPKNQQRLFPTYSQLLSELGEDNERVFVLDADLALDMGVLEFADRFPDRYLQCGIAESDMVSMACGIAAEGGLPIVHSFSCFLATRPNEQIYNAASERRHILYVGGLSGVLPAGPGHSHQSVRDISCLGSIPGMVMLEPSCEAELSPLLSWCVEEHDQAAYLRMVSIPVSVPYRLPDDYAVRKGVGCELKSGQDAVIISYGMTMLTEAWHAAESLEKEGRSVGLINLPWLNDVDEQWLAETVAPYGLIVCVDDHLSQLGQGQMLLATLAGSGYSGKAVHLGLEDFPPCGKNEEVLDAVGLGRDAIAARTRQALER